MDSEIKYIVITINEKRVTSATESFIKHHPCSCTKNHLDYWIVLSGNLAFHVDYVAKK